MLNKKFKPLSVVWETTLRCNMKCLHCGSSAGDIRTKELTTNEGIKLIEDLEEMGTRLISLMGGEVFLRKDWQTLAQHIRDSGMNVTLMSNGYLIDKKIVNQLSKLEPYAVTISIDGGKPETHNSVRGLNNSFERCVESLELLRNADIPTTVITTVHKLNFKELPLIRDILLSKGIAWQIQMANPVGRFPKELMLSKEEFYSVALFIASTRKKHSIKELPIMGAHNFGYNSKILPNITILPWIGCQAGLTAMGIQSNGGVKSCLSLSDDFVEGNIRERSIKDIWNDPDFSSFNRNFKKEDLNGECKTCKHGKKCKGGCLTVSTSVTGKKHADPFCLSLIEGTMINP